MTTAPLIHSSLNRDKGPRQAGRGRPGAPGRRTQAGLAGTTLPWLTPRPSRRTRQTAIWPSASSARGLRPARAQSPAAHILKHKQPLLSRIDSNFLKRESADSMNQPLPRERVVAPARNIHLQNNSFPRPELSANTLAGSPGTRGAGAVAGTGEEVADSSPLPPHHCPRLQPPRPRGAPTVGRAAPRTPGPDLGGGRW